MTTSLEDLIDNIGAPQKANSAPQAAETTQPAHSEPEQTIATQEASTGVTEPSAPQAVPPTAVEEPLDKRIAAFQKKAEDETRKRQDYEKQLRDAQAALVERDRLIEAERQRIAAQQQQQQPDIDLYDPEQARQYVQSVMAEERQALMWDMLTTKVETSQELMRDKHADYVEMETVFAEEMEKNPQLQRQMWAASSPARFAYDYAKKALAMREIGDDPVAFRERERERIRAEEREILRAEQQPASQTLTQTPVPQPPKTLAGVPSAARNVNKQPWKGPTPLEDLLK